jgi:hypothetical protein
MLEDQKAVKQKDLSLLKTQKYPKVSSQHHLLGRKTWKYFPILREIIPRLSKVMRIDKVAKVNCHLKQQFGDPPNISLGIENLFEVLGLYKKF